MTKRWSPPILSILAAALTLCMPAAALGEGTTGPNVYLYDMGSETSPRWAGFARVTPAMAYDAERGYGWLTQTRYVRALVADYADALAIDHIECPANVGFTFRHDLPEGHYVVWLLTGSHASLRYLLAPHALSLQGQKVISIEPTEDEVFRATKYEWSKGDDPYDHFVKPRFTWLRHEVEVSDGKLLIGIDPGRDFPICALVIAEETVADRVADEIQRIDRNRKAAFYDIWQAIEPKEGKYEPVESEDRKRGYMVSAANYLDTILPWSEPPPAASRSKIEIFATPGEQEQTSFCVYGLIDLRHVDFEVSDLRTAKGDVIAASNLERGLVQFAPRRIGHGPKFDIFPVLILPARPTFVGKNTCKRFWITVHVPEDAAAGIYEGTIRIFALDAPPASLRLRLRVLPFKLKTPPVERYMYFGSMIYHARALLPKFDEKKFWESVRAEARFLKENEFCLAQCLINRYSSRVTWKDGKKGGEIVDVDLSPTYKIMEIIKEEDAWPRDNTMVCLTGMLNNICGGYMRAYGQRGRKFPPTPEGRANFIRAVQIINGKGKKEGWPEIAFECAGENTNYGKQGAEFALDVARAFKDAGVSHALRGNGWADFEAIKAKLVDYPQPNWAMMQKDRMDFMKANSKRMWAYNFARGRFGYGWFCFKHGITRASHECGIYFHRQPGNIFDNRYGDFPFGLPTSLTSLAPAVNLKRAVEGADDYKYLHTLDSLIKTGLSSAKPGARQTAEAAKAWLDGKLKSLPDGVEDLAGNREWYGEVREGVSWYVGDYDKYRWQAAVHIMNLQKELGR